MVLVSRAICNRSFTGNSSFLPRSKFDAGGQESCPETPIAATPDRCGNSMTTL